MDKENVVHSYNGILFSKKKEQSIDTCCGMNFKNIMPSERSDMQRLIIWCYLYEMSKTYRDRK